MRLTQQQRARRRVTRYNNRVRRALPLFAATGTLPQDWTTTFEQELLAIQEYDRRFEMWRLRQEFRRLDDRQQALRFQLAVKEQVTPQEYAALVKYWENSWSSKQHPVYALDHWCFVAYAVGINVGHEYPPDRWNPVAHILSIGISS